MSKKKIRLYLGVDPTGRDLHLGHAIALRKLQQFADLGHEAILVVGTGTVLAGDPSQRETTRARITQKEVAENIKTWKKQASKIISSKVKFRANGEWLSKLRVPEILEIASNISASQLFQRDMFQERLKKGNTVWTHELLYPLLQGYDSVHMDVDLEIGGTDQVFNMLVGRELQKKMKDREKYVLTVPMLLGLDGKQMSKTSQNTVNILDVPEDMYGKLMSMKDDLIEHYFELCTEVPIKEVKGLSPRDAKAKLAKEIVRIYHGEKEAQRAEDEFQKVFQEGKRPSVIPTMKVTSTTVGELLVETGLANSKSDARRLIEQGGVKINDEIQKDAAEQIEAQSGMIIQVGPRRFMEIL